MCVEWQVLCLGSCYVAASCIPSSRFINAQSQELSPPELAGWLAGSPAVLSDADLTPSRGQRGRARTSERAGIIWRNGLLSASLPFTTIAPSHRVLLDFCRLVVMLAVYY